MDEIELKYQVPPGQALAVDRAVAGRTGAARQRLQAAYFDTAHGTLAAAGLALRLRREGRRWVQTLKSGSTDAMTRFEHNAARGGSAAMPALDPGLHAEHAVGRQLLDALHGQEPQALQVQYRTDILRRSRTVRKAHGQVELAYDTGHIEAGAQRLAVCELEFELLSGSPRAVLEVAQRWAARFDLWLDGRSKAERGSTLARGQVACAPRVAQAVVLTPAMDVSAAWSAVLRSCADQILANASQIAGGPCGPEHVHQLRVGLRRLRSALRLFDPWVAEPALAPPAARLFAALGQARDRAVLLGPLAGELRAAMVATGLVPPRDGARHDPLDADADAADDHEPGAVVRAAPTQQFLLELLAAMQHVLLDTGDAGDAHAWRRHVKRQLRRWHRQVVDDAGHYAQLDDTQRHTLRKRAKRLRYASEFAAALYEPRAVRRYLRALRELQDRLGAVSDVVMAGVALGQAHGEDPVTWFARGWLAARREHLIDGAVRPLRGFARAPVFWK